MSSAVSTALTPGTRLAAAVSMDSTLARGYSDRRAAPNSRPSLTISSA